MPQTEAALSVLQPGSCQESLDSLCTGPSRPEVQSSPDLPKAWKEDMGGGGDKDFCPTQDLEAARQQPGPLPVAWWAASEAQCSV